MSSLTDITVAEGYTLSTSPISKLAPELLAEVFHWCILNVAAARLMNTAPPLAPYSWLTIRHVCHTWRDVALAFPELSTHIWLTRPECVIDMLGRSGTLPLHIHSVERFYMNPTEEAEMLHMVLSQFERVADASFVLAEEILRSYKPDPQLKKHTVRASQLRSLKLYIWRANPSWRPPWLLFAGFDFPALRELTCVHTNIAMLHTLVAPRLCHLRLFHSELQLEQELLPLLNQLGVLEELELDEAMRSFAGPQQALGAILSAPNSPTSVTLPRLKRLSIKHVSADAVFYLLHRLSFPLSASVVLQASWRPRRPSSYDSYVAVILAKIEGLCFHTLSLSTTAESGVTFRLWGDRLAVDHGHLSQLYSGEAAHFSCSLRIPPRLLITYLIEELPLGQIECTLLSEQAVGLNDAVAWETVLSLMPSVEDLVMQYETFDYLANDAQPYRIRPANTYSLCPSLETLRIRELHHWSSLMLDFSSDVVHLGCVARGLAERKDGVGKMDITREVEDFHEEYPCPHEGGRGCRQPPGYESSLSAPVQRRNHFKARILDGAFRVPNLFKRR
ncbi:uncharacterized protein PHACADRAFT_179654 [Phanerochaete carnosa HHB-10118-sp]|uniref:F-box domain-containing protein n=1 Tax=Phanerochaete carnosa (strain HHB-10118-sp) TaxID=650164 RepID=K5VBN0_PHACS|nr:uncharacterized protein PHACADRAFT_179654 [Phanerochaete carnosa HHB-10118-sp]EKM60301.1 hypothetical protein PHACADRAFT_179654 [Phanerochaete carnosa HHB-10118-sp]